MSSPTVTPITVSEKAMSTFMVADLVLSLLEVVAGRIAKQIKAKEITREQQAEIMARMDGIRSQLSFNKAHWKD